MQAYAKFMLPVMAILSVGIAAPAAEASPGDLSVQEVTTFTGCTDTHYGGACNTWSIQTQTQCSKSLSSTFIKPYFQKHLAVMRVFTNHLEQLASLVRTGTMWLARSSCPAGFAADFGGTFVVEGRVVYTED